MIPRRLDNRRRPLSQEIMFYDNILKDYSERSNKYETTE